MSKTTRGLVIAAAAASLFLAGCATQGDNGSGTSGAAFTTGNSCAGKASACKGMSHCKGMMSCKGKGMKKKSHHRKAARKAEEAAKAEAPASEAAQ